MTKPVNFLYIMTDQHRADWLGCAGHPVVKTPNIDALAARGTRFTDFHVASPVCMPNRAAFMTGRYPTTNGMRFNGGRLSLRANTFVDVLRAGGYRTALLGKSHLQTMTADQPHDWQDPKDAPIPEAWKPEDGDYLNEEPHRYQSAERFEPETPYYGFDEVDLVTMHGAFCGGHYLQWLRDKHPDWQELRDPANQLPHDYTCPQAIRTKLPEDSYPTAYVRDRAKDYLRANANNDQPLFTFVSFPDPHHPFTPPGKYWDMYSPDDFEIPNRFEDHENPPPPLTACRKDLLANALPEARTTAQMVSDQHVREAMALSAGMITMIDDAIGEIIAVLEETGQLDNTVIIFNSDHGDYLGDFNLLLKGPWMSETITKVPMIWADPTAPEPAIRDDLGSTLDMAPTILERAGITPYVGMQGRSLLGQVGGTLPDRDTLMVEYNDGFARMGFDSPARVRGLLTEDWRLVVYRDQDWGELYDRRNDPLNLRNRWDDTDCAGTKAQLMESLTHHLIAMMDDSPRADRPA
ncbi:MAG: sulfatase [Paracoccaceae bacterium]